MGIVGFAIYLSPKALNIAQFLGAYFSLGLVGFLRASSPLKVFGRVLLRTQFKILKVSEKSLRL
ncbi:hypothetical protein PanWU01x14_045750 [Parasponia andersonii]|uniref:Uncharacterized protein n=1 Tax=Parasponia andersonii TaxID=3476 RepID=A0A2P5DPK7_PARAD|nr:hypothetical protein PanWU01x14_045750 [Parasponia andersonii]